MGAGQNIYDTQSNDRRDDARGGGFLLAHQMLGTLALGTEPTNGQVIPIVINGTTITVTAVTSIGSTANNVLIGGSALAFATNLLNFLRRPDLTTSTQVAASGANQTLLSYVGWAWPGSSTNIVAFSLNKNVNGITGGLTSFNITGITVTSATWTANTLALYVQDGAYYINGTRYLFTGGVSPTVTPPGSNSRIDVLAINSSGTLAWTTGTSSSSPVAPTYPSNQFPICELTTPSGATALYDVENQQSGQGYISNDVRAFANYVPNLGAIAVDLAPASTDTQNLGESSSSEWLNIYGKNIYASSIMQLNGANVAFSKFGGTGSDGALSITSGTTTLSAGNASVFVKNYSSISITGTTGALAFSNPATGGTIVVLKCQGNTTVTSSNSPALSVVGMGGAGGAGATTTGSNNGGSGGGGASAISAGSTGSTGNGSPTAGSAGSGYVGFFVTQTGGGGGTASAGIAGTQTTYFNTSLAKYQKVYVMPGSGGGGGAKGGSGDSTGSGGVGGGGLYIECAGALNITGTISAAGTAGGADGGGVSNVSGSGGGGGGGSIVILYNTLTANSGTYTVSGGAGGSGTGTGGAGANGFSLVATNTEFA